MLKALLALCKDTAACKAFCSSLITSGNSLFLSFGFNDSLPVTKGVKPSQVLDLAIQLSSSSVNSRTSLLKSWPERWQDKCPYRELQRLSCGYSPFVHESFSRFLALMTRSCSVIKRSKSSLLKVLKSTLLCDGPMLLFMVRSLIKHLIMSYFTIAQNRNKPHKNAVWSHIE